MEKTVLFYAAVKDVSLFHTQMFYENTREMLELMGLKVIMTNKVLDAINLKYDAILCFFFKKGVVPVFFAKCRGKKVFFTGGLDDLERSRSSAKRYYLQVLTFKLCRMMADSCLIESKSDMDNINKIFSIRNYNNLFYSPQAIDTSKYECRLEDKESLFATICWQGTDVNCQRKGVDKALVLFKELKELDDFSNYKFIIMGKAGDGTPYLKKIISDLNLEDSVLLTGEVAEDIKIDYLKRSEYFFQLSEYEGFGLAALEAVASRCIPIHSAKGGLRDTLAEDGLIVDIGHFNSVNEKASSIDIDRLLSITDSDVEEMHKRIVENFDSSIRIDNFKKTIGASLNVAAN